LIQSDLAKSPSHRLYIDDTQFIISYGGNYDAFLTAVNAAQTRDANGESNIIVLAANTFDFTVYNFTGVNFDINPVPRLGFNYSAIKLPDASTLGGLIVSEAASDNWTSMGSTYINHLESEMKSRGFSRLSLFSGFTSMNSSWSLFNFPNMWHSVGVITEDFLGTKVAVHSFALKGSDFVDRVLNGGSSVPASVLATITWATQRNRMNLESLKTMKDLRSGLRSGTVLSHQRTQIL